MESLSLEERIKAIVLEKLGKYNIQYDSVKVRVDPNVKRVGVQGDERTYKRVAEVKVLYKREMVWNTTFIREMSTEITNRMQEVNGVVYVVQ